MEQVAAAGCDTLITADLKYHQFQNAAILGMNLIDAGHFETENPVCAVLQAKLARQFPTLGVRMSRHQDCIRYL